MRLAVKNANLLKESQTPSNERSDSNVPGGTRASNAFEWIVADRLGAFAMGTATGLRTRKYHGFLQGIAGRAECAGLVDFEMLWGDQPLWPHQFRSLEGQSVKTGMTILPSFELRHDGSPSWSWELAPGARLGFAVEALPRVGIRLTWRFTGRKKLLAGHRLKIRPFFALRNLHALGGDRWEWQRLDEEGRVRVLGEGGKELACQIDSALAWASDPVWYERFEYSEEIVRGYDACENLFSAGTLEMDPARESEAHWILSWEAASLDRAKRKRDSISSSRVQDFVLEQPAGVVAGYPWFGEWGRDTFISVPGIVAAKLHDGESMTSVLRWTGEIMEGWGRFIGETGMLPNLVEKEGTHQWESADATLWWTHSLASLWQLSLSPRFEALSGLVHSQRKRLDQAIQAIRSGKHSFLRVRPDGLLEVTMAHTTWMDARVDGHSVTPRVGLAPEINALWFQAQALQILLSERNLGELRALSRLLHREIGERERPNRVFLHSLPLSPSFVFQELEWLHTDVERMEQSLWTPVGLRTLDPHDPDYSSSCCGPQRARDMAYHQGPAWAWLAGHFEMAKARMGRTAQVSQRGPMLSEETLEGMPIAGHISEIFDSEAPFAARGAPAQAWSLACLEEHRVRQREDLDARVLERISRQINADPLMSSSERRLG